MCSHLQTPGISFGAKCYQLDVSQKRYFFDDFESKPTGTHFPGGSPTLRNIQLSETAAHHWSSKNMRLSKLRASNLRLLPRGEASSLKLAEQLSVASDTESCATTLGPLLIGTCTTHLTSYPVAFPKHIHFNIYIYIYTYIIQYIYIYTRTHTYIYIHIPHIRFKNGSSESMKTCWCHDRV